MNYSAPRGDETQRREEAQPCKQVPGAEICLLITSLGWGWAGRAAVPGTRSWGAGKAGINQGRPPTPRKSDLPDSGAGSNYWRAGRAGSEGLGRRARLCVHALLPACTHALHG